MRYSIVLGRGIEGCGVTKCAIEASKALGARIYAAEDKKWSRGKSMDYPVTQFMMSSDHQMTHFLNQINDTSDVVLFFSVPSITHPQKCQDNFTYFIAGINKPKIFCQFDHKMQSIRRNSSFKWFCDGMDHLMTHSLENDFAMWLKQQEVETPLTKMTLGFNFDEHRAKYWEPIDHQDHKTVRWIGRTAGWKNPNLMVDFHNSELRKRGFITILEGLEANIGYEGLLKRKVNGEMVDVEVVNKFRCRKDHFETPEFEYGAEVVDSPAYLYPPYNNEECMNRLSLSAFGSDLYKLDERFYGGNIENCHAEIVASGCVPIFHRHFLLNVFKTMNAAPYGNGTIGLDETSFKENSETMTALSSNLDLRDNLRESSFAFWKSRADISIFHKEIQDVAERLMKEQQ